MRLCALTLNEVNLYTAAGYRASLKEVLLRARATLAVLPAYSALLFAASGGLTGNPATFPALLKKAVQLESGFYEDFLSLNASLARELGLYLVPGTFFEKAGHKVYHSACCFNPAGEQIFLQRQTHLSREEKEAGLSRGEELGLFEAGGFKAGLLIATDQRHPETGRLLALKGANLVLGLSALEAGSNCFTQTAGLWAQTQQNQFWAAEAPLCATLAGRRFAAAPAIYGPCEITPEKSGYLSLGYAHYAFAASDLDEEARLNLVQRYPLLKLLNPKAYAYLSEG